VLPRLRSLRLAANARRRHASCLTRNIAPSRVAAPAHTRSPLNARLRLVALAIAPLVSRLLSASLPLAPFTFNGMDHDIKPWTVSRNRA